MFLTDSENGHCHKPMDTAKASCYRGALNLNYGWGRFVRNLVMLLLLLGTFDCSILHAQTSSGTITGLVTDEKNSTVGGADVTITGADGTFTAKTVTSSDGIYSVPSIPPGIYTVLIQAKGFTQSQISQLNVTVAGVTKADAVLTV